MKQVLIILSVVLHFIYDTAEARIRNLSLERMPDAITAHDWLNFNVEAFDKHWLERKVSCHFDENNDDCSNLAALLRMYAEVVPSKRKLKKYASSIKESLAYDKHASRQVAMFLSLYAEDASQIEQDDIEELEYWAEDLTDEWTSAEVLQKLHSKSETVVEGMLWTLIDYPYEELMVSDVFDQVVKITKSSAFNDAKLIADMYLEKAGYLAESNSPQELVGPERITVTSGGLSPIESLVYENVSQVWQHHVKFFNSNDLSFFLKDVIEYTGQDCQEKIDFVIKLKAYKRLEASTKFIIAELMLEEKNPLAELTMKEVYKEGNKAMKSALVSKYPDMFPAKEKFWRKLMKKSTETELVLVKRNKVLWDAKMARLGSFRKLK